MKHLPLFDLIAPLYTLFYKHQKKGYQASLKRLKAQVDLTGCRILDVGCGTGALTSVLAQNAQVIGFDGSLNMIKEARKLNPTLHFESGDVTHGLPVAQANFDVVISAFVLHGLSELQR